MIKIPVDSLELIDDYEGPKLYANFEKKIILFWQEYGKPDSRWERWLYFDLSKNVELFDKLWLTKATARDVFLWCLDNEDSYSFARYYYLQKSLENKDEFQVSDDFAFKIHLPLEGSFIDAVACDFRADHYPRKWDK